MHMIKIVVAIVLILLATGCTTVPEHSQIEMPVNVETPAQSQEEVGQEENMVPDVGPQFTLVPLSEEYVEIFALQGGYAGVKTEEGYGIIDISGQMVSSVYEEMFGTVTEELVVTSDGKKGVLAADGTVLIPCQYDEIAPGGELGYYCVTLDGKTGIINVDNQICLPLEYEEAYATRSQRNLYYCGKKDEKWALIGEDNQLLTEFAYDTISTFFRMPSNGIVSPEVKWQYYGTNAYAQKDGCWGLLSDTGKEVTDFCYTGFGGMFGDRYILYKDDMTYLVDKDGAILQSGQWEQFHSWDCIGTGQFLADGEWYAIQPSNGETTKLGAYTDIQRVAWDQFAMINNDGCTLADSLGNPIGQEKLMGYDGTYTMLGLTAQNEDGLWGILGLDGQWTVAPAFDKLYQMEDLYTIDSYYVGEKDGEAWLYSGEFGGILPLNGGDVFQNPTSFLLKNQEKYGLFSMDGQVILPMEYDGIQECNEGYFTGKIGKAWALFDTNGNQLTDFIFDETPNRNDGLSFKDGVAYVEIAGKQYFLQIN